MVLLHSFKYFLLSTTISDSVFKTCLLQLGILFFLYKYNISFCSSTSFFFAKISSSSDSDCMCCVSVCVCVCLSLCCATRKISINLLKNSSREGGSGRVLKMHCCGLFCGTFRVEFKMQTCSSSGEGSPSLKN